jgi:hypothetical protein
MISKRALIALTAVAAGGCQPQTLADQYLAEMEEIGNVGSTVLLVEESESHALVLGGGSAAKDLEAISLTPYLRSDGGWERNPMGGTSCSGPSSSLGFHGGYVYCGSLTPEDASTRVSVAGNAATIVDLSGGDRVWFVYSEERADPERGS